jgi:two-component system LytT family sensor kinase
MPESFVEPAAPFNVDLSLRSHRTRWDTMPASPPARLEGSSSLLAIPLIPGRQTVWVLVLGGWTIVGLGYFCSQAFAATRAGASQVSWGGLLVFSLGTAGIWAALTPATLWLTRNAIFAPGRRAQSAGIYALTGVGFFLVSGTLEWMLGLITGVGTSRQFWTTLLSEHVETRLLAYFTIIVLGWSARYFALYRTRHELASELEARLAKTHLQVLKMQLQPHFLFNTLNTIAELVHTDSEAADQMITRLGRLLRLSLDHAGHQVVPLRQEADFLRVYIEIEQVRFQDRLQIVWDLEPDTLEAAVPTLLWQPVLENAIRHGVTPLAGRGRIVIASHREGEELVLEIRDNGRGVPEGAPREGVGLRNVRGRLDQLYGARARFTLAPLSAEARWPHCDCHSCTARVPTPRCHSRRPIWRSSSDDASGRGGG